MYLKKKKTVYSFCMLPVQSMVKRKRLITESEERKGKGKKKKIFNAMIIYF